MYKLTILGIVNPISFETRAEAQGHALTNMLETYGDLECHIIIDNDTVEIRRVNEPSPVYVIEPIIINPYVRDYGYDLSENDVIAGLRADLDTLKDRQGKLIEIIGAHFREHYHISPVIPHPGHPVITQIAHCNDLFNELQAELGGEDDAK